VTNPSIIACDGVVFVTTRFPHGSATELIPEAVQREIGVEVGLRTSLDNDHFVVIVSDDTWSDSTESAWDAKVCRVLQYIWREMMKRKIVAVDMPDIVKVSPFDMLH
jgi:hypothetical protein